MDQKEAPSQAEKLEAVADAGPGATDQENATQRAPSEQAASNVDHDGNNDVNTNPSTPSDVEASKDDSEKESSVAPPRSALKNALIMASLCVSKLRKSKHQIFIFGEETDGQIRSLSSLLLLILYVRSLAREVARHIHGVGRR